jgi:hypothetical protein
MQRGVCSDAWFLRQHCYPPSLPAPPGSTATSRATLITPDASDAEVPLSIPSESLTIEPPEVPR